MPAIAGAACPERNSTAETEERAQREEVSAIQPQAPGAKTDCADPQFGLDPGETRRRPERKGRDDTARRGKDRGNVAWKPRRFGNDVDEPHACRIEKPRLRPVLLRRVRNADPVAGRQAARGTGDDGRHLLQRLRQARIELFGAGVRQEKVQRHDLRARVGQRLDDGRQLSALLPDRGRCQRRVVERHDDDVVGWVTLSERQHAPVEEHVLETFEQVARSAQRGYRDRDGPAQREAGGQRAQPQIGDHLPKRDRSSCTRACPQVLTSSRRPGATSMPSPGCSVT